jgi:hypothetical protein
MTKITKTVMGAVRIVNTSTPDGPVRREFPVYRFAVTALLLVPNNAILVN